MSNYLQSSSKSLILQGALVTWGWFNYSISHIIKRQFPSIRSNSRVCVRDVCKGPDTVIWLMGINQVETSGLGVIQMFWPSDSIMEILMLKKF